MRSLKQSIFILCNMSDEYLQQGSCRLWLPQNSKEMCFSLRVCSIGLQVGEDLSFYMFFPQVRPFLSKPFFQGEGGSSLSTTQWSGNSHKVGRNTCSVLSSDWGQSNPGLKQKPLTIDRGKFSLCVRLIGLLLRPHSWWPNEKRGCWQHLNPTQVPKIFVAINLWCCFFHYLDNRNTDHNCWPLNNTL